jgi:protein-S-isoprenylcysteine O-methyltransferase Ste14
MQNKDQSNLLKGLLSRVFIFVVCSTAVLFIPAGTFAYWQAWAYLAILILPALIAVRYLYIHEPDLLRRRMQYREKREKQKLFVLISYPFFILSFILPGLDHRFGWSSVPAAIVLLAYGMVLAGYYLFILVARENRYASRIIEVEEGQKVIQSGPYGVIRHPLYLSTLIIYSFSPLGLGSWWAVLPALFIYPTIIFRILDEEKLLRKELAGYEEYCQRVRYRLIPGIW